METNQSVSQTQEATTLEQKQISLLDTRLEGAAEEDRKKLVNELGKMARDTDTERRISGAVAQFIQFAVQDKDLVSNEVLESISAMIQHLDEKLSEQINLVIHHSDFQKLEGSWRGLQHLVYATETGTDLKIRLFNVSKNDLGKTFKKFQGTAFDQSPLFKKVYSEEYDMAGGTPYGVLIGDYQFTHEAKDIDVLKGMAKIAAAAHAPFIAAAAPSILDLESWTEVNEPRDLATIMQRPEWATWRGFRESVDAKYVGLVMPRFLSRLPYGKQNEVEGFDFVEKCEGGDHSKYTWSNAAYAMGANITQAYKYYGWTACIRGKNSGGEVTGLNVHTFPTSDGGVEMKCPTEVSIPDRKEHELAKMGLAAIIHWKNTDRAAFLAAPNVYLPKEYDDDEATANAKLNGALPYIFVVSRFAHFLKHMVREAIGSFQTRESLESWLQNWIAGYVTADGNASQEIKARYPLAKAEVQILDVPGQPGYYTAVFKLQPHYQLEGVNISLRLVAKKATKQ